ncbi:MAG: tetratricopeptide repeat protein [Melioribacteraceae bacterium]|nr:tetratricopeptide repeat protein [Melioribacteraceae bacterium]
MMRHWKTTGLVAAVVIVLAIPMYIIIKINSGNLNKNYGSVSFIGKERCVDCHKVEYDQWQQSDHRKAMDVATDSSVLGNFNNSKFVSANGKETLFYKRDGKFFVKTEGVEGKIGEYEITHTFGYTPLQQYLIPFDDGKYQCLPIAWDTKKMEWFSLAEMVYPDENLTPTNWLYWTNGGQNWNGMCAECHSTNLKKNYDPITKTFSTTYSEINVSCEACHGPGSAHEDWANLPEMARPTDNNLGLIVKTSGIDNREYVELCTRCHSRRSQFSDFEHGRGDLLDSMLPTLLNENYHPDGQILEEVYVYGSFIQSKMYANKVQCNNCHNVHTGKLVLEGNALCSQCHRADIYDAKEHHFHKYENENGNPIELADKIIKVGEGTLCIKCHMPGQYYMGVDYRPDHSIRVPRPDLTISINTPNACNDCHADKSPKWADDYITKWYGLKRKPHYGTTFAAARESDPTAENKLIEIAKDNLYPLNVRATAISLMNRYNSDETIKTIQQMLDDDEPLIRETSIRIYSNSNITTYKKDLLKLLNDPVKAVRASVAIRISELPINEIPDKYRIAFTNALSEYKDMNLYMADFPSARMNLGVMYANQQKLAEAAKEYEEAIKIDSLFIPAKVNLAILYNQLDKNDEAEIILRDLVKNHSELFDAYYYLGLLLAEKHNYSEAVTYMQRASHLMPERGRINYNTGLMLQYLGRNDEAEKELLKALETEPNNFDFLYGLADHYVKLGEFVKAKGIALKLKELYPSNSIGDEILNFIAGK